MFGTIMRARVKPGHREDLEREFQRIADSYADSGRGLITSELAFEDKDPNRLVLLVHFTDRDSYFRNADDPRTNADYQHMVEHLEGEPEWIDVAYGTRFGASVTA